MDQKRDPEGAAGESRELYICWNVELAHRANMDLQYGGHIFYRANERPGSSSSGHAIMPLFALLTGIANLFGIGGASLISRSLGAGEKRKAQSLLLSLLRKGGLDIPFVLLMNHLIGAHGIPWAMFISDLLSMLIALLLFYPCWKQIQAGDNG